MLKNMKIRTRMLVSYFIIVALLLVVGITSIIMLQQVSGKLQQFYNQQFKTVENSMNIRRTVFSARGNILGSILLVDSVEIQDAVNAAEDDFASIYTLVDEIRTTYQGDKSQLDRVVSNLDKAKPILDQVGEHSKRMENEEAFELYMNSYKPYMDEVRDIMAQVGDVAEANALDKVEDGAALAKIADMVVIILIVVAVVASVGLALLMSDSVRKPVEEMRQVASRICKGDMEVAITYHSEDELGEMADNMREMAETVKVLISDINYCMEELAQGNFTVKTQHSEAYIGDYSDILRAMRDMKTSMSDTLSQIEIAAEQVNAGGEQVSNSAQALAQGATEQASSVQELAATIQDVSQQVESTASHARTAKRENDQSHQQINVCSADMESLMNAMNKIETHSNEISKVIKTIEDIAFQTNILALNAAVEAARAGSAGKGFAVVADEVRDLASKSAEASKNTAVLIENSLSSVENGRRIADETAGALEKVVTGIQEATDMMDAIARASREQADAITQITVGIDQISSVVQTNSATSEESAAASEELSSQAQIMKDLVRKFKLDKDLGSASAIR